MKSDRTSGVCRVVVGIAFGFLVFASTACRRDELPEANGTMPLSSQAEQREQPLAVVEPDSPDEALPNEASSEQASSEQASSEQASSEQASHWGEAAAMALESGDLETADRLIRQAIAAAPRDPEINFVMGQMFVAENRFAEAIHLLDKLAKTEPRVRLPVLGQTAEWMELQGDWVAAEQRYRAILAEVPDATAALRKLSYLLMRQGRRLEAAQYLQTLCQKGNVEELELRSLLVGMVALPGDSGRDELEPIGALGQARYEISQGNLEGAIAALELIRETPAGAALRARIDAETQDYDSLATWVESEPLQASATQDYWVAMGVHQAHTQDHRQAIVSFSKAVLMDVTDRFAYISMSESLAKMGATRQAETLARRAQLIAETQSLGATLAEQPSRDAQTIRSVAEHLDELHRPFEALCWRALSVVFSSSMNEAQQQRMLASINQNRLQLLQNPDSEATREFILGGIDVDTLEPLPRTTTSHP